MRIHIDDIRNAVSFELILWSSYLEQAKCGSKFLVNKNCHVACANLCTFCAQIAFSSSRETGIDTIYLSLLLSLSHSLSVSLLLPMRSNKCAKISILTFQFWILLTCLCGTMGGGVAREGRGDSTGYLFNLEPGNRFHWFTKFTLISSWNDAPLLIRLPQALDIDMAI